MKRIKSLRIRFAIWTTVLILSILTAFGGFVYFNLNISLHNAIDNSLSLSAAQIAASLNVESGQIIMSELVTPDEGEFQTFSERGLGFVVVAKDGTILESTSSIRNLPPAVGQTDSDGSFATISNSKGNDLVRVYTLPIVDDEQIVGWVQATQSLGQLRGALDRLLVALLLGGGLLSLLAGFGGYFLAARALIPIDNITSTAAKISSEDLSARLNLPDTGDEVSHLAMTFDNMLARIESGFKRERQFAADASHELRTPLAAMQAISSVMREGDRTVAEYHQAMDDLNEETNRMIGVVEELLSLARGEGRFALHLESLNLSVLLSDLADSLRPLAQAKGLALTCDLPPELPFIGDVDAIIHLFADILDNSIKYTESGSIRLSAHRMENAIKVEISDTGIGIPPEHLPHVFERFYRVESARSSPGTGLGLAIAQQLAQAHGGEIKVESTLGAGTKFLVILPS